MIVPALAQSNPPASAPAPANRPAATAPAPAATHSDMWRASKLIGLNVYNDQNEKLGDISEILLDKSGKVDGVVIGVGGFLGLGEKDVAVKMDQLTVQPEDANKNNVRLILNSTKADLEAAPEFKSVAAQNREMNSNTGTTGSTMPAAPANPPASSTGTTNP
jgi:sporulation protein YlmC with PRC-barrel domain